MVWVAGFLINSYSVVSTWVQPGHQYRPCTCVPNTCGMELSTHGIHQCSPCVPNTVLTSNVPNTRGLSRAQ